MSRFRGRPSDGKVRLRLAGQGAKTRTPDHLSNTCKADVRVQARGVSESFQVCKLAGLQVVRRAAVVNGCMFSDLYVFMFSGGCAQVGTAAYAFQSGAHIRYRDNTSGLTGMDETRNWSHSSVG